LILVACLMMSCVHCKKDGYPVDWNNCMYDCGYDNAYCEKICKEKGGESGYCYFWKISCYCEGLPDNVEIKGYGRCRG
nr:RecName: Full=Neurotoxin LmNaTx21.1; Flags: Precursor [Lychas mucronatus]